MVLPIPTRSTGDIVQTPDSKHTHETKSEFEVRELTSEHVSAWIATIADKIVTSLRDHEYKSQGP